MNEIWKDILGYENLYKISNYGNIISYRIYKTGKLMKPSTDKDGYLQIGLRDIDRKRKWFRMHRLVAIAFIENPLNLPKINHKDGKVNNNYVENLEWCDDSWNNKYRHILNPDIFKGENCPHTKHTNEEILQIYNLAWEEELTQKEIANMFNVTRKYVSNIKRGSSWTSVTHHDSIKRYRKQGGFPIHVCAGEKNGSAKLTNNQVLEIYELVWNSTLSYGEIAKKFNVTTVCIGSIKHGKTWNSITHHLDVNIYNKTSNDESISA
jgi:predicted DNA-binding protein YlxM (UPF0122 family)